MLDAMIRRIAVFMMDAALVVLHAISLLKTLWFVLLLAAIVIYWAVFVYKPSSPTPPAGPGQYLPPVQPAPGPAQPSAPVPSTQPGAPSIVLAPQQAQTSAAPIIQAAPVPGLNGITPPPPLPAPLPDTPAGFVRGYRPPLGPAPYRPE